MEFFCSSHFETMYPFQIMPTKASTYSSEMSTWINSKINQLSDRDSQGKESQLKNIAHLSYDLLSWVRKMERLNSLQHLDAKAREELESVTRLVGTLILCLKKHAYADSEMMDSLIKRYTSFPHATSLGLQA